MLNSADGRGRKAEEGSRNRRNRNADIPSGHVLHLHGLSRLYTTLRIGIAVPCPQRWWPVRFRVRVVKYTACQEEVKHEKARRHHLLLPSSREWEM